MQYYESLISRCDFAFRSRKWYNIVADKVSYGQIYGFIFGHIYVFYTTYGGIYGFIFGHNYLSLLYLAELVAVYGRRRVGKTFLIRNAFSKKFAFEFSGIHRATLDQQLEGFSIALANAAKSLPLAKPNSWLIAFEMLKTYLTPLVQAQRTIIFIDEFSWIDTSRSGFLQAFEQFWNTWASRQVRLVVVICGSAASWMISKVLNNRGGLLNRVTKRIRLLPFTLSETEAYLRHRKIKLDQYQLLQLYMAMGGIPHYLKEAKRGESTMQLIDRLCFTKDGILQDEFKNLYYSLFDNAQNHIDVIRVLAKNGKGLSRSEIIDTCNLTSGGSTTRLLEELTESGFIASYIPFGKSKRDVLYRLIDEYSLFYLKFIDARKATGNGTWLKLMKGQSWISWSGNAFESICLKHISQTKNAMGIEALYTEESVWRHVAKSRLEKVLRSIYY